MHAKVKGKLEAESSSTGEEDEDSSDGLSAGPAERGPVSLLEDEGRGPGAGRSPGGRAGRTVIRGVDGSGEEDGPQLWLDDGDDSEAGQFSDLSPSDKEKLENLSPEQRRAVLEALSRRKRRRDDEEGMSDDSLPLGDIIAGLPPAASSEDEEEEGSSVLGGRVGRTQSPAATSSSAELDAVSAKVVTGAVRGSLRDEEGEHPTDVDAHPGAEEEDEDPEHPTKDILVGGGHISGESEAEEAPAEDPPAEEG